MHLQFQHLVESRCVTCGCVGFIPRGSFSVSLAMLIIDLWQKLKSVCFFFIVFSFLNIFLSIKMFAWTTMQSFRCEIVERLFRFPPSGYQYHPPMKSHKNTVTLVNTGRRKSFFPSDHFCCYLHRNWLYKTPALHQRYSQLWAKCSLICCDFISFV